MRHAPDPLLHDPSCHAQVGAPDADKHTSPILGAGECLAEVLPNQYLHQCVFNDAVQSGAELLRCEAPGVWVRQPHAVAPDRPPARPG